MSHTRRKTSRHDNKNHSNPSAKTKSNSDRRLNSNLKIAYPPQIIRNPSQDNFTSETKKLLVSEWVIQHEMEFTKTDHLPREDFGLALPGSPILGSSSFTKRLPESSIVENSKKRRRRQSRKNDSNREKNPSQSNYSKLSPSSQTRRNAFEIRETSPDIFISELPTNLIKSPILGVRKFKRRNLSRQIKIDEILTADSDSKIQSEPNISTNTIPDVKSNLSQIVEETFFEDEQIEEKREKLRVKESGMNDFSASQRIDDLKSKKIKIEIESASSSLEEIKEDEIGNDSTFIEDASESEENESFIIDDVDTPAVFVNSAKEPATNKNSQTCKSRDSQDTFFSKAESQFPGIQPSQRISEISSARINHQNSSEVNNIISNETPSPKPVLEPFGNIPRSEKKKRRVKKGSLAEKLQTSVKGEISYLRIWQHQVKQSSFQNNNNQFVELCIQKLYNAYNRQFAECCLISDKCNLLKSLFELDTEIIQESQDVNSRLVNKILTIMIVPEIVDNLKAKNGDCLKVYPPWDVVDKKNLILSIMRFTIDNVLNFKISNDKNNENLRQKRIESFDCPCVKDGKIVENCNVRFANTKPNVIQEIFNS